MLKQTPAFFTVKQRRPYPLHAHLYVGEISMYVGENHTNQDRVRINQPPPLSCLSYSRVYLFYGIYASLVFPWICFISQIELKATQPLQRRVGGLIKQVKLQTRFTIPGLQLSWLQVIAAPATNAMEASTKVNFNIFAKLQSVPARCCSKINS